MKKWNLHTSLTETYEKYPKPINSNKDFTLTKSDKQYVCVVMYFNDPQKYKLRTAHYYFYPPKYFDKN